MMAYDEIYKLQKTNNDYKSNVKTKVQATMKNYTVMEEKDNF